MNDTERTERSPLARPPRVVVGATGSASSAAAVRLAAAEARRSERPLVAVLAWEPPGGEAAYRLAPAPELVRIWERAAMQRLDAALASAFTGTTGGVAQAPPVELVVVRGPAARALTWLADRPDDLLVLGAGTRHRLARVLRGRVRRGTPARSCAPVMLAAPPAHGAGRLPALPRSVRRELHRLTPEDFLRPPGLGATR